MRRPIWMAAITLVFVGLATRGSAVPLPNVDDLLFDDDPPLCLAGSPAAAHVPFVDADSAVTMPVALVADRAVTVERARELLGKANAAYNPLGVTLVEHSARTATLTGTSSNDLIQQTKTLFGGSRPAGADAVMTVTSADLDGPQGNAVIGQADCLGGIRFAAHSFFVVEDVTQTFVPEGDGGFSFGPVTFWRDMTGKTVAHELGHLLGAQHHYSDCAENADIVATTLQADPCTLMTPVVDLTGFRFGALESSVVRGYAEEFASP